MEPEEDHDLFYSFVSASKSVVFCWELDVTYPKAAAQDGQEVSGSRHGPRRHPGTTTFVGFDDTKRGMRPFS